MTELRSKEPALDEIQWRSAPIVQNLGGIHSNTVHHYFMESPFFDPTSNNNALRTQAHFNPAMAYLLHTREAFESRLRTMQGLEFMVVAEPQPVQGGDTGVWLIRKQNRRKRQGAEDEITLLATYYVIGENVYQAPSLENIVRSKILSATTSLGKFFSTAATLPVFTPATGHIYPLPARKQSSAQAVRGKADTPAPDNASQIEGNVPKEDLGPASENSAQNTYELFDSLNLALRYGSEYMDENPLQGEPGSFVFSATNERLQAQHLRQQEQAKLQAEAEKKQDRASVSAAPTPIPDQKTGPTAGAPRKGSKSDKTGSATGPPKIKRRKSKAPNSPMESSQPETSQKVA